MLIAKKPIRFNLSSTHSETFRFEFWMNYFVFFFTRGGFLLLPHASSSCYYCWPPNLLCSLIWCTTKTSTLKISLPGWYGLIFGKESIVPWLLIQQRLPFSYFSRKTQCKPKFCPASYTRTNASAEFLFLNCQRKDFLMLNVG